MSSLSRGRLAVESLEARETPISITFSDVLISSYQSSGSAASDDVIVDGRIITAENYDSAARKDGTIALDGQKIQVDGSGEQSGIVFSGGWGMASYQYGFEGTYS